MGLYIRSVSTDILATGSDSTSHVIDLPASVNTNDLLVMLVQCTGSSVSVDPTGFTSLAAFSDVGEIFYKYADGTEGGTTVEFTTDTSNEHAVITFAIGGHNGSGSLENATATGAISSSPNFPELTPSWGEAETLWIASIGFQHVGAAPTITGPSGYTLSETTADTGSSAVASNHLIYAVGKLSVASSEDPPTCSLSSSVTWRAITLGVRPGPDGALFWSFP